MVTRTKQGKRWKSVWCALCAIAIVLAPLLGAMFSSPIAAVTAQADEPGTQAVEPIDYKPKLYKMLGYNKQIDTSEDEIRMDFVLRVAHGQVNTSAADSTKGEIANCATGVSPTGRSCGLKLMYDKHGTSSGGLDELKYISTMAGGLATAVGAAKWAKNVADSYTIHSLIQNGAYDYLSISIEGDAVYDNGPDKTVLGGVTVQQYVYAEVKAPGATSFTGSRVDSPYVTNIAANYPAKLYNGSCDSSGCNGPRAFVGYDGIPAMTGGGQPNWGMVTDNGLALGSFSLGDGWAPPKTFFTYWYNPSGSYSCSKVSDYYFQWLALKNGKDWVPVSDLTPKAQPVWQVSRNGDPTSGLYGVNVNGAFNFPAALDQHIISLQGPLGTPSPAQLADGSINFKKAKETQGLDGYFKLVTWPVTTNADGSTTGCATPTNKSVYNPLTDYPNGVTEGMTSSEIDSIISTGWTIDTAYYKYTLPVVDPPVITTPADNTYSPTTHPTIEGTGIPGHVVYLYAEDPSKQIQVGNPDDPDTRGRYVGEATVDGNGHWSIVDNDNAVSNGQVRYHAWQTEQDSGSEIASIFSNIQTVKFGVDPAPVVNPVVTVPHTKRTENGQLEAGAKVHISGTAAPLMAGDTLKVYASHATSANVNTVAATPPTESDLIGECTQTLAAAGSQSWACDVSPSYFLTKTADGETFLFRAKIVNTASVESGVSIEKNVVAVDMTSTQISISDTSNYQTLRGTGYTLPAGSAGDSGATITVKWPDNSESTTLVATDGTWSVNVPAGMTSSGTVYVTADDTETNEAGWVSHFLNVSPPVVALPKTGDRSRLMLIIAGIVAALLAAGFSLYLYIGHKMKSGKVGDDP